MSMQGLINKWGPFERADSQEMTCHIYLHQATCLFDFFIQQCAGSDVTIPSGVLSAAAEIICVFEVF